MLRIFYLNNSAPDPASPDERHHEDVGGDGAGAEGKAAVVKEGAEEEGCRDLGEGRNEGCEGSGADAEVEGEVGGDVWELPRYVEEVGEALLILVSSSIPVRYF